jgi:hypothetical protein
LIARGWQRAGALVGFFLNPTSTDIVRPEHLCAVRFDFGVDGSSRCSRQTLRPLSEMLGVKCDDRFGEGQEQHLARAVVRLQAPAASGWPDRADTARVNAACSEMLEMERVGPVP